MSNQLLKIVFYYLNDQPSKIQSWRSVLNLKFSVLTVLRSKSCSMSIEQNCATKKKLRCIDKSLKSWILVYLVWPWYSTWAIYAVMNSGISCLALIFNLNNLGMTILHPKNWFKVTTKYDKSYRPDYSCSCCIALEQMCLKRHGHCFSLSCWKY